MRTKILRLMLVVMLVICIAIPQAYANSQVRILKVLVLTDGKVPVSRIHKEISNANSIIEGQVYTRLEVVDVLKLRWNIAIAYIRLKNGRKFMGKCAGRYIMIRSTAKGCGIITAHEVGHSFVGHQHDSMGLMSAKAIKKKDTSIMYDTALRWKNYRWKQFN